MKSIRGDLIDIYKDFYGGGSDEVPTRSSGYGSSGNRGSGYVTGSRPAGSSGTANFGGPGSAGSAAPGAAAPIETEIETELVTEKEYKPVATSASEDEPEKPKEPERSGKEELEELIGLKTVKHDVEELVGLAKVMKMRKEKGMKAVPVSLHLVFSGNPGTGKTTVARILAKLYKEIGILSEGQLVETDRAGLVAGYVGQTAIKTQKKIEEAIGGILFIDEAYTLNQEGENFGQEAIDTILKAMEDRRDEFVVIVAGYTELMKAFVESNPGLKSRFNKFFEFPDYTVDELQQIFELQCNKYQYKLTEEADAAARKEIIRLEACKGENFANAREVRNLFEKIITNQAARVADLEDVDEETLVTITIDDLQDLDELERTEDGGNKKLEEIIEVLEDLNEKNGKDAKGSGKGPKKDKADSPRKKYSEYMKSLHDEKGCLK
ncbi:MAG: AAA family ATPase [Mogibacterium sp.]|nr:AAA family ATPase [Mogibacterium sp.]